jgi:hypothetical protein
MSEFMSACCNGLCIRCPCCETVAKLAFKIGNLTSFLWMARTIGRVNSATSEYDFSNSGVAIVEEFDYYCAHNACTCDVGHHSATTV